MPSTDDTRRGSRARRRTSCNAQHKTPRDDFANYRAICLLCHSYKLLSAVIARRLMEVLDGHLPDTQAGFRPARGCRDNVCALRWFIAMVLREGRNAVITLIDYSAAFDSESQIFLDGALADAGVSTKVRCVIQAIFAAATGIVRVRLPSGVNVMSEPFNIERGVLQGDIFSPVSFIAGLDKLFRTHDIANSGVVVGNGDSSVLMSKFEYADDAALIVLVVNIHTYLFLYCVDAHLVWLIIFATW